MLNIRRLTILLAVAAMLAAASLPAAQKKKAGMRWAVAAPAASLLSGDCQAKPEDEGKLLAVIQSAEASENDKANACQWLAVIGTKKAVPVLAALLDDEKFAHYARFGLEPIPDSSVDDALRGAMNKLQGNLLVGVINSIGARKDAQAVEGLKKLLAGSDLDVAAAAAAALGRIATDEAAKQLQETLASAAPELRPRLADSCLACAEQLSAQGKKDQAVALYDAVCQAELPKHLVVAGTRGAILAREAAGVAVLAEQLKSPDEDLSDVALRAARELKGGNVSKALAGELAGLAPGRQALVILALADIGDAASLPVVLEAAKAGPAEVRAAAARALGQLGDASAVPVLLESLDAPEAEVAQAAKAALVALKAGQADAAIVARLDGAVGRIRLALIEVAGERRAAGAVPAILKAADDADQAVRLAAIKALGETVGPGELGMLMNRLISPKSEEEKAAAQQALQLVSLRTADREACAAKLAEFIPQAPLEAMELLGTVGGDKALQTVVAAARSADPNMQDAATRVLGEWMSADAAPVLLDLAKTMRNEKFRIRALRGAIRVARQLDMPMADRMAACRDAMALADREEDRKEVVNVLSRNPSPEALALAVAFARDPELKGTANLAISIAEKIVQTESDAVAQAMAQLIESNPRGPIADRAKALLGQAKK